MQAGHLGSEVKSIPGSMQDEPRTIQKKDEYESCGQFCRVPYVLDVLKVGIYHVILWLP